MPRITAIETAIPDSIMPNLILVRVHTDDGLIGCGTTFHSSLFESSSNRCRRSQVS